ncbi:MAG: hypothetical protein RL151_1451, partial [Bacteroidota bacterium]
MVKFSSVRPLVFAAFLLVANAADAAVRLPRIFSDGMVLQRGRPVPVWGWSDRDETVTLSFNGSSRQVKVKKGEKWKVLLPEQSAGGPYSMTV